MLTSTVAVAALAGVVGAPPAGAQLDGPVSGILEGSAAGSARHAARLGAEPHPDSPGELDEHDQSEHEPPEYGPAPEPDPVDVPEAPPVADVPAVPELPVAPDLPGVPALPDLPDLPGLPDLPDRAPAAPPGPAVPAAGTPATAGGSIRTGYAGTDQQAAAPPVDEHRGDDPPRSASEPHRAGSRAGSRSGHDAPADASGRAPRDGRVPTEPRRRGRGAADDERQAERRRADRRAAPTPSAPPVTTPTAPGGPAVPATHTIAPGEHLWLIAAEQLAVATGREAATLSAVEIAPYWTRVCMHNAARLPSGNPNLVHPGEVIELPPA